MATPYTVLIYMYVIIRRLASLKQKRPPDPERCVLNFDQSKADEILNIITSCDKDSCGETINIVTNQISDAFKCTAGKTLSDKKNKFKSKRNNNRPWFGFKCQTAGRSYHLARKKHSLHKAPSTRDSLTLASRFYKQTMNSFINKYKFNQQSKLRKMQKGQPRSY